MIVEILVAQGEAEDPLSQERTLSVFHAFGIAWIRKGVVEGIKEPQAVIDLTQEEGAGVGGEGAAREIDFEAAGIEAGEVQGFGVTLCHRGGPLGAMVQLC